jgi:hypothetical protein
MPAEPGSVPPAPPKTLPHALSRAAKAGALNVGLEDRLGKTLNTYAEAMEKASLGFRPESCIYRAWADSGCLWDDTGRRCSTAARPRDRRHVLDPLASHLVVLDRARHEGQGERQDGEVGIGRRSVCVSCCMLIAERLCVLIGLYLTTRSMKSAAAPKQEQYRLQVEEAEDKLVQMTETAIGLMKAVLENVSRSDVDPAQLTVS